MRVVILMMDELAELDPVERTQAATSIPTNLRRLIKRLRMAMPRKCIDIRTIRPFLLHMYITCPTTRSPTARKQANSNLNTIHHLSLIQPFQWLNTTHIHMATTISNTSIPASRLNKEHQRAQLHFQIRWSRLNIAHPLMTFIQPNLPSLLPQPLLLPPIHQVTIMAPHITLHQGQLRLRKLHPPLPRSTARITRHFARKQVKRPLI
jgi:hypothetical protein